VARGGEVGETELRQLLAGLTAVRDGDFGIRLPDDPNGLLGEIATVFMATAICGLYDPESRTLRWARAGHLPPVLLRQGTASLLALPRGGMLGVTAEAGYQEDELELAPGDMLVLYTDGLIERRDRDVDEALAHLLTMTERASGPLEQRLDHLVTYSNADTDDDTCIVAIQLR
jgi:serine phosphatase RsbU (regulator of sigma subunit)